MTKVSSPHAWVEVGYKLFAENGLEAIQVEPLARAMGMNKSGFYHYFGDRESYLEALMNHHVKQAEIIASEYQRMNNLIPDFVNILMHYPTPILAHMQLVRNKTNKLLNERFDSINIFIDRAILPFWAEYVGLSSNPALALKYFELVRDTFYSRITKENYNADFITALLAEAKDIVRELRTNEVKI